MTAGQALEALRGIGTGGQIMLVQEIRLPRVVAGLAAGAALGLSGCLTQALARNRLATPDMLGVNQGAVIAIMSAGLLSSTATLFEHWWTGPLGALVAAVAVFAISGGTGTQGYRFIVTGLAVTTLAGAVTQSALAWNGLSAATAIHSWSVGSLAGRGYPVALPVAVGLAVLLPAALAVSRRLAVLRFSEDVGVGLGTNPGRPGRPSSPWPSSWPGSRSASAGPSRSSRWPPRPRRPPVRIRAAPARRGAAHRRRARRGRRHGRPRHRLRRGDPGGRRDEHPGRPLPAVDPPVGPEVMRCHSTRLEITKCHWVWRTQQNWRTRSPR
nr:hypothetical protein GCM10020093_050130 [Planobispora longispora]